MQFRAIGLLQGAVTAQHNMWALLLNESLERQESSVWLTAFYQSKESVVGLMALALEQYDAEPEFAAEFAKNTGRDGIEAIAVYRQVVEEWGFQRLQFQAAIDEVVAKEEAAKAAQEVTND